MGIMDIPEIRDKVLQHVIVQGKDGDAKFSASDIRNLRLVNHQWCDTVSTILRLRKIPFYELSLGRESEEPFEEPVRQLNKLAKQLDKSGFSEFEPTATFALCLFPQFFQDKNRDSFSKFLSVYGSGLVSLDISYLESGNTWPAFPNISLPNLSRFGVACEKNFPLMYEQESVQVFDSTAQHCASLVQSIFQAAPKLKSFLIWHTNRKANLPRGIEKVVPPSSITTLKYGRISDEKSLSQLLTGGNFPKLQELGLYPAQFTTASLLKIFEKFRNTLKTLKLIGIAAYDKHDSKTSTIFLQFPVMSQLEELIIDSNIVELDSKEDKPATKFPKLSCLELSDQSPSAALKWMMNGTRYVACERVTLRLLNVAGFPKGKIEPKMIEAVHQAFPNLRGLNLRLNGRQTDTLRSAFRQLTDLEHLTLEVARSRQNYSSMTPEEWTVALMGEYDLKDGHPTIHRLTKLKSLTFCEKADQPFPTITPLDYPSSILSTTFKGAFLRMKSLVELNLSGTFWVSKQMTKRWRKEKGNIQYFPGWRKRYFVPLHL